MRDATSLRQKVECLGLSRDEAAIFVELLNAPKSQLGVSRATGIVRSNVYRIVDGLMERGLLVNHTSPSGRLLAAARPDALERLVVEQEVLAKEQRLQLNDLLPSLLGFGAESESFTVRTYVGVNGIKQMLWNELRTKSEILLFSGDTLDKATGRQWAEKFRREVVERGIKTRGIQNLRDKNQTLSAHTEYDQHYRPRFVSQELLDIQLEVSVYDDKVCIYNSLAHDSQLGTEVTNSFLARFMRQVFEHYWSIATP